MFHVAASKPITRTRKAKHHLLQVIYLQYRLNQHFLIVFRKLFSVFVVFWGFAAAQGAACLERAFMGFLCPGGWSAGRGAILFERCFIVFRKVFDKFQHPDGSGKKAYKACFWKKGIFNHF